MGNKKKLLGEALDGFFADVPKPSREQLEAAKRRVLARLNGGEAFQGNACTPDVPVPVGRWLTLSGFIAAVAILVVVAGSVAVIEGKEGKVRVRAQQPASPIAAEKKTAIAFEEASIRPTPAGPQGARGRNSNNLPPAASCDFSQIQVNPGRFIATNVTLYYLVGLAFGRRCPGPGIVSGGPEWIKTERLDIQAIIPKGATAYSIQEFMQGNAPSLQAMLQNLLADRFKLVLRHESKQMQGFNLIVVTKGKLKPPEAQDPGKPPTQPQPSEPGSMIIQSTASVAGWVNQMESQMRLVGPVVDKTGLTGLYDFRIEYPPFRPDPNQPQPGRQMEAMMRDRLPSVMQEQLGLKLEPATVAVEVFVIESVEKPSEN